MSHNTSHSEVAEIVAIMSWFRQTNTFFVNELHDSLKRRFFMNKAMVLLMVFQLKKQCFLLQKLSIQFNCQWFCCMSC